MSIVDDCAAHLSEKGYTTHGSEVISGDASVEFDRVLLSPEGHKEIVLLLQDDSKSLTRSLKKLKLLTLLLNKSDSFRSFTLVIIAKSFDTEVLNELYKYARIVPILTGHQLEKQLKPLVPLKLPPPVRARTEVLEELYSKLGQRSRNPVINRLIKAADKSANAVEERLIKEIDSILSGRP